MDKEKQEYPVYETCADCAYHHCKTGCAGGKPCSGGDCLYLGENKHCSSKRCEHFKDWRKSA